MTLGIRNAISSIRNGRGGRNRGALVGIGGRTSINVVGGGVEIDYDEKYVYKKKHYFNLEF